MVATEHAKIFKGNWDDPNIARPNADGVTVLPAEWYCPEDEGLYDDLVPEFGIDGDGLSVRQAPGLHLLKIPRERHS